MIPHLQQTDIAIITKDKVATTFSGLKCQLLRRIEFVRNNRAARTRTYKVRTDLVCYEESQELVYDKPNTSSIVLKQRLVTKEQREDWTPKTYDATKIDALDAQIAKMLPKGLGRYDKELKEQQLGLLLLTQQEAAWGVASTQWQPFSAEDLVIDLDK